MIKNIKFKKVFSFLIVSILLFYVIGLFNIVDANANGIGTVSDTYSRTIVQGAEYTFTESDNGKPQKNYVLEYDPKVAPVEPLAVFGNYAFGGDTLSTNVKLAESKGYTVIAGVNGSPFDTSNGLTIGTLISNGIIISASDSQSSYDSFAIKEDGTMFISESNLSFKYNVNGSDVRVNYINKQKKQQNNYIYLITSDYYTDTTTMVNSTEVVLTIKSGSVSIGKQLVAEVEKINESTTRTKVEQGKVVLVGPSLSALGNLAVGNEVTFDFINNDDRYDWENVKQSICGFYEILKDGEFINTGSSEVHPRTTIGFKPDGKIVLYVVDGRQPNFSIGLSDLACAQYMKSLGCVGAIRMDGGGSSTMALRLPGDDHVTTINSPSDGGERSDADGLLLVLKNDFDQTVGSETLLHAYPNNIKLLENTVIPITVKATDERYNPKEVPSYQMEVINDCGTITADNKFQAKEGSGNGKIRIYSGSSETFVDVMITNQVDELYANVNNLSLSPNEKVSLSVKAYNNDSLLVASNEAFTWTCSPEIGTIDNKGNFVATSNAGVSGTIEVSYGTTKAKVMVTVGQLPVEITGFENETVGNGTGQWRNTQVNGGTGGCSINENLAFVKYGEKSLKIDFNLANTTGTVGTQISRGSNITIDGTPTAIGMWVYATQSAYGAWIRIQYAQSGSNNAYYADFGTIDWTGWKYLEAPIDEGASYPISVKYLVRIMAVNESQRINGTIYVDQLRAVYGFTNDDFDSPIVTNLTPANNGISDTTTQTISCDITDEMSGVNKQNTKFYLDGEEISNVLFSDIPGGYTLSWTPSSLIPLTEGIHTIKVRAEDNYNNFTIKEWKITIDKSLPVFSISGEKTVDINKPYLLSVNTSKNGFDSLSLTIKYDPSQVKVNDIEFKEGIAIEDKKINESTGTITLKLKNNSSAEFTGAVVNINYVALVEGEISFKFEKIEFTSSKYQNQKFPQSAEVFTITGVNNYDFNKFIDLVNSIDEENILLDLEDLGNAVKELENFNKESVTDANALAAIAKLERCLEKYNAILEALSILNSTSTVVGNLVGGR